MLISKYCKGNCQVTLKVAQCLLVVTETKIASAYRAQKPCYLAGLTSKKVNKSFQRFFAIIQSLVYFPSVFIGSTNILK